MMILLPQKLQGRSYGSQVLKLLSGGEQANSLHVRRGQYQDIWLSVILP